MQFCEIMQRRNECNHPVGNTWDTTEASAADLHRCGDDAKIPCMGLIAAAQDALLCTGQHLGLQCFAGPLILALTVLLMCCHSCGQPARHLRIICSPHWLICHFRMILS